MKPIPILNRPRVDSNLEQLFDFPLTLVTAPMGYGKSTTLSAFLKQKGVPSCWITLNAACRNTGYFWSVLTRELSRKAPVLAADLENMVFPSDSIEMARLSDLIRLSLQEDQFILVLDDYYLAESPELDQFIIDMALEEHSGLRIVLLSRFIIKSDLTLLEVRNILYRVDSEFLKFDESETARYFAMLGLPQTREQLHKIHEIADGWIAALYLIYRGFREGIPLHEIRGIQSLIRQALFEPYPTTARKSLCALSFLDSFTPEFAEYATGIQDLPELLERCLSENAFFQRDPLSGVLRIHFVFREFLQREAARLEIDRSSIFRRAGLWYQKKQDMNQSFYYLDLAGDYGSMLVQLEEPELYIRSSDRPMIFSFFDGMPSDVIQEHPVALLKVIYLMIISGDRKRGSRMLEEFAGRLEQGAYAGADLRELKASIHLARMFLCFNDLKVMIRHIKAILRLLDGRPPVIASYQGPFSFGSPHLSYIYYRKPGTFRRITDMEVELYSQISGGAGFGSQALLKAEYALETGRFEEVEPHALAAIYQARSKNQTSMVACAYFTLARLYRLENRYGEAMTLLEELETAVSSNIEPILRNTSELCRGYFFACSGEYSRIASWIREGEMTLNSLMKQGAVFSYVVYGKALLLSGNMARTQALCESFIPYFQIFNNQLGFIHNYIHLAIASHGLGQFRKAGEYLDLAMGIASQDQILLPFAENGIRLLPLLEEAKVRHEDEPAFLEELLALTRRYAGIAVPAVQSGRPLTERELEILRLMAKGQGRNEIAQILSISPATVRTHAQHIYEKLEVCKKSEALKKAAELHLLEK